MITILITIVIVILEEKKEKKIKGLYFNDLCLLYDLSEIDF